MTPWTHCEDENYDNKVEGAWHNSFPWASRRRQSLVCSLAYVIQSNSVGGGGEKKEAPNRDFDFQEGPQEILVQ